jgi:hypothetical protein
MSLYHQPPNWVQVAQSIGILEAEVYASVLKSAHIPVYLDSLAGLPSLFGYLGDIWRVFVPEAYYTTACALLDDETDGPPQVDGASLIFPQES